MTIDRNNFFREATLKICGNLDFEKALQECLLYLRQYMPADLFQLNIYDRGLRALRTVAFANSDEARRIDKIIPLDEESLTYIEKQEQRSSLIVGPSSSSPLHKRFLKVTDLNPDHSGMVLNLRVKNARPGNLVLFANGKDCYSEEDLELFSMLNEPFTVALSNALRYDEVNRLKDAMADDLHYLRKKLTQSLAESVIGEDFGLKKVMEMARSVALLDSPVLLTGETGVGKEVIATAIHQSSRRRNGPFIKVNCGAIPDSLIDSELFGHEKGAFTGAIEQNRGCFERAGKGTIFLDEIAELPLQAQVRMLRVLQEKKIRRVGGGREIDVDIRIIAATHQSLEKMVEQERFRSDLWFRLNVFPITIPPLRERRDDIPALVSHFMTKKSKELGFSTTPVLAPHALETLVKYYWPGNVRELENVVERAMIIHRDVPLSFDDIVWQQPTDPVNKHYGNLDDFITLDALNKGYIAQVLAMTGGKVHGPNGAATLLGMNPSTLRFRIRKLGIQVKK